MSAVRQELQQQQQLQLYNRNYNRREIRFEMYHKNSELDTFSTTQSHQTLNGPPFLNKTYVHECECECECELYFSLVKFVSMKKSEFFGVFILVCMWLVFGQWISLKVVHMSLCLCLCLCLCDYEVLNKSLLIILLCLKK